MDNYYSCDVELEVLPYRDGSNCKVYWTTNKGLDLYFGVESSINSSYEETCGGCLESCKNCDGSFLNETCEDIEEYYNVQNSCVTICNDLEMEYLNRINILFNRNCTEIVVSESRPVLSDYLDYIYIQEEHNNGTNITGVNKTKVANGIGNAYGNKHKHRNDKDYNSIDYNTTDLESNGLPSISSILMMNMVYLIISVIIHFV